MLRKAGSKYDAKRKTRGRFRRKHNVFLLVAVLFIFLSISMVTFLSLGYFISINEKQSQSHDVGALKKNLKNSNTQKYCTNIIRYRCSEINKLPTSFQAEASSVLCEHDLRSENEYLPNTELLECVSQEQNEEWIKDRNYAFNQIQKIQNPLDCNNLQYGDPVKPTWKTGFDSNGFETRNIDTSLYSNRDLSKAIKENTLKWNLLGWLHHGYAYNLYVFTWNAGDHWANKVPVLTSNSKYRFSDVECGKSWSCILSPLSRTCSIDDVAQENILVYYDNSDHRQVMSLNQVCEPYGRYNSSTGRCECDKGFMPSRNGAYTGCAPYSSFDFEKVPRRRHHKDVWEATAPDIRAAVREGDDVYFSQLAPAEVNPGTNSGNRIHVKPTELRVKWGFLWEHAHYLYFLHKDAPQLPEIERRLSKSGFSSGKRSVGMHVRHGDSCHDKYQTHRTCLDLDAFMKAVQKLEAKYGKYDQIFIATDDEKVISDTHEYEKHGYKFVYQKIDRFLYEHGDEHGVDVRKEFNNPELVLDIATDIWGISSCDAFVGSFASSVAWVAYELMLAKKGMLADSRRLYITRK
eukprot:augustus_masked-scaffold_55-processed-gene-0.4-mRNA-1 protein AED:0.09 eAED:0.10 QI:0/0/0/1/1/1/2/0/574